MNTNPFRSNGWSVDQHYADLQKIQEQKKLTSEAKRAEEKTQLEKSQDKNVEKNTADTFVRSKSKPEIDINAVQLDLNLEFDAESLKDTLDKVIGREKNPPDGKEANNKVEKKKRKPFLSVNLSVKAKSVEKTKVSGTGKAREIDVRYRRRRVRRERSEYNLDNVKLNVRRRQREAISARLQIRYRNGYRIVRRRIAQRYHDDVSIQAKLLQQFDNTTQKVAENKPEDTGKFLKTTERLVSNKKVSGKTVSKFFDVVESYVDKTRKALHKKIDQFINTIARNFNIDGERLNEMKNSYHNKVDSFFDNVNNTLDKLEAGALKFISGSETPKQVNNEAETVEESQPEPEPVDVVA